VSNKELNLDIKAEHNIDGNHQDRGVVYVATGSRYVQEALISARSLHAAMPGVPITVFADSVQVDADQIDVRIIQDPVFGFGDKVKYMNASPYKKTLFVDTDTFICNDISDCFDMLDKFDLLVAHDALRVNIGNSAIGRVFPEFNTGVIFYRKNQETTRFFSGWLEAHEELSRAHGRQMIDQFTFRQELYNSELRFYVLPPEYNCMLWEACYLHDPVKILHGRHDVPLHRLARDANAATGPRIFKPGLGCHRVHYKTDIIGWAGRVLADQAVDCMIASWPFRVRRPTT
jgi:hypothetical protein